MNRDEFRRWLDATLDKDSGTDVGTDAEFRDVLCHMLADLVFASPRTRESLLEEWSLVINTRQGLGAGPNWYAFLTEHAFYPKRPAFMHHMVLRRATEALEAVWGQDNKAKRTAVKRLHRDLKLPGELTAAIIEEVVTRRTARMAADVLLAQCGEVAVEAKSFRRRFKRPR